MNGSGGRPGGRGRAAKLALVLWCALSLAAVSLWAAGDGWVRRIARVEIEAFLDGLCQGAVHIDRIAALSFGGLVAEGVTVIDPAGRVVLRARRLSLGLDLTALLDRTLEFTHGALHDVRVRAIPSDGMVITLFDALYPNEGGDGSSALSGLKVRFEHIHVSQALAYGDIPGVARLRVTPLEARGAIWIDDEFHARVTQVRAELHAPYPRPITITRAVTSVDTGPLRVRAAAWLRRGEDRVHASMVYAAPEQGEDQLALTLNLDPISADLLTDVGVAPATTLLPRVYGHVVLQGPTDHLRYRAALQTEAGALRIHGRFRKQGGVDVTLHTPKLALDALIAYAPPVTLSAAGLSALAQPSGEVRLEARAQALNVYGVAFGPTEAAGTYADGRVRIADASLAYAGGRFQVRGWVDAEANLSLEVRSHVPQLAREPWLRQRELRAELHTDMRVERRGTRTELDGTISLSALRTRWASAAALRVSGRARFDDDTLAHPRLRLRVSGRDVSLLDYPLGKAEARLHGAGGRYQGRLATRGSDNAARMALTLRRRGDSYHLQIARSALRVGDRSPWLAAAALQFSPDGVVFEQVSLVNGPQRLALAGHYSFSQAYRIDATLQRFDLGGLRELLRVDLADLDGTVDAELTLHGAPGHPRVQAYATLQAGQYLGMTDLGLLLSLGIAEGRFDLDAQLQLPDASTIAVYMGGTPGRGDDLSQQLAAGRYTFQLAFDHVPFSVARPWLAWLGKQPPPGSISAEIRGEGPLTAPSFSLASQVHGLQLPGWPALDLDVALAHEGQMLRVSRLELADPSGELLTLEGQLSASLDELADPLALRSSLDQRQFRVAARWPERRLDQLPQALRLPVAASAEGELEWVQRPGDWRLVLHSALRFTQDLEGSTGCNFAQYPQGRLALRADAEAAHAELVIATGTRQLGRVTLQSRLPLLDWASGRAALALPPIALDAHAETDAAEELPVLCHYVAGPLGMHASAEDLFSEHGDLQFQARSPSLQLVPSAHQRQRLGNLRNAKTAGRPFALSLQGASREGAIVLQALVDQREQGRLALSLRLPQALLALSSKTPVRGVLAGTLRASALQLAPLLIALPTSTQVAGLLDGQAAFAYALDEEKLTLDGRLRLRQGRLVLASLGQVLSDVEAQLALGEQGLTLERFVARDFDGVIRGQGELNLEDVAAARLDLDLTLRDFPLRREGAALSKLTGRVGLRALSTPARTQAELSVDGVRVNLPSDLGLGLQDLDRHADIDVVGESPPPPAAHAHLFEVRVLARRPFRIVRSDLNAEVLADMTIRYQDPALSIQGSAEIKRGRVELYGKRFELQHSRLAFDSGDHLDPLVSLYATYEVGGDVIGVRVDGRLSDPQVSFTHSDPNVTDRGVIIAQLLGARRATGREAEQTLDPASAAAGVLAGATAGLLTDEVRRTFGGAIPVLAMESGGSSLRASRIRAGLQLDQLIERRLGPLRHVVQGAYVEGFVAPGADPEAAPGMAPQSRAGGLLELTFPADLIGAIEYQPVHNWRIDIAWEP